MKTNLKYIFAALSMTLFVGCSHDSDFSMPSTEEALQNAAEKLGVEIDPSMTWNAATAIKANVSVNLGLDEEYTVVIYDKNPLFNDDVHYYAKTTMKEGETVTLNLDVPECLCGRPPAHHEHRCGGSSSRGPLLDPLRRER